MSRWQLFVNPDDVSRTRAWIVLAGLGDDVEVRGLASIDPGDLALTGQILEVLRGKDQDLDRRAVEAGRGRGLVDG